MNFISSLSEKVQRFFKNKHVKIGAPILLLAVCGSFGLKEFRQIRYKYAPSQFVNPAEFARQGIEMKAPGEVTLESEFDKIKNLDIDNWKNIRGPRPWEMEEQNKQASQE